MKIKSKKEKEIDNLKQQLEDLANKWKRALADYQNLEKQVEVQKKDWIEFANSELIIKLLPILENLEKASVLLKDEGLGLTVSQLKSVLEQEGLEEVIVSPGKTQFDAKLMECIDTKKGKQGVVLQVTEKGYLFKGEVLKPARVIVGKN